MVGVEGRRVCEAPSVLSRPMDFWQSIADVRGVVRARRTIQCEAKSCGIDGCRIRELRATG